MVLGLVGLLFSNGPLLLVHDFRAFYSAGEIVRHHPSLLFNRNTQDISQQTVVGPGPLLTFYHPAYEALFYVPLTLLRYKAAYFVYMGWNMLLLWVCYLAAPPGASKFAQRFPRPSLFFLSFPLLLCVFVGQNSLLFLLATCLVYKCYAELKDRTAGLLLGLALFKLPIAVPLALLLAVRRGGRFIQGFALSAAVVILVSVWVTGIRGSVDFLHLLWGATLATDHSLGAQKRAAVLLQSMPNIAGFLHFCGTRFLPAKAAFVVNVSVSVALFVGGAYIIRATRSEATAFCMSLICALLLSPHLYIYDFSTLVLPILLLQHKWMPVLATIWFTLLPILCGIGFLTWFAPAVAIPILLLGMCISEFRDECRPWKMPTQSMRDGLHPSGQT
jgi:hypothetical protein